MSVLDYFSTRLKTLREEKGLSQDELGKALGISRGSISFYEKGSRTPDIEVLDRISRYFNVSLDYLLGYSISKSREGAKIENSTGLSEDNMKWLSEDNTEWLKSYDEQTDVFSEDIFETRNQFLMFVNSLLGTVRDKHIVELLMQRAFDAAYCKRRFEHLVKVAEGEVASDETEDLPVDLFGERSSIFMTLKIIEDSIEEFLSSISDEMYRLIGIDKNTLKQEYKLLLSRDFCFKLAARTGGSNNGND